MRNFERNQPVILKPANSEDAGEAPVQARPAPRTGSWFPAIALSFAAILSAFWLGIWGAYLWGYFGAKGLAALGLQQEAMFAAVILLPPMLFIAIATAFARASRMGATAEALRDAAEYLFTADETAARGAARLGRVVRRELDALNAGLDGAFARLRALETALENQVAALDEAGARAEVRGEAIAARLTQESRRMESLGENLADAASKAAETVAGRSAQLRASIETAEGSLKMAAQALDVQAAGFRAAATAAADAPHLAAVELDSQSKKIEQVSDAALARAEFVLARQEKHRTQMNELLGRLKEDSAGFESALAHQRASMEKAVGSLGGEAQRLETLTGDAEKHLELIMSNAASRANQLTAAFSREAEKLRDVSDAANGILNTLTTALREAGAGAQTLIGESAAQARQDAKSLVGDAMAECEKLLRAAGEMSAESAQIRAELVKTMEEVERHMTRLPAMAQSEAQRVSLMMQSETDQARTSLTKALEELERHVTKLPTLAQGEAQRIRQLIQVETDQMLDMSARTLSTIHARGAKIPAPLPQPEPESEGLKGLARKLTQRSRRDLRDTVSTQSANQANKNWEMKTLLAAVETSIPAHLQTGSAALGALELALSDMAVDLEAIVMDAVPSDEEWKRYLSGDRAVFARKLAAAIDDSAINRITSLYREDARFHDAADAYIAEFESLLTKAREGDGGGGLLASTMLSADTGKIYLAIAYALGRL
jgi:hypothetical protein